MLGHGILAGKKTYIMGALAIAGALAGYLVGDLDMAAASQLIVTAVLSMTVRMGIARGPVNPA